MAVKPMLGDLELELVQEIEASEQQVRAQHAVPALEGDFLQALGRRAAQVTLSGILAGDEAAEGLKQLREKFKTAQPVPFVADIATATQVDQVLIEEMGVRELAGKPRRFEYAFTLREFIPAPPVEEEEPPEPPEPPPPPNPQVGQLIVEVVVEGRPEFDFSTVTVRADPQQADTTLISRTLVNRANNVWTEDDFPPGSYNVKAAVSEPEAMADSAPAVVTGGQQTKVTLTLRPGSTQGIAKAFIIHYWFDKAFIEPCMRAVLRQVIQYANDHTDERMLIVGHTDLVGDPDYNLALGERRARGVHAFLTFGSHPDTAAAEWNELRKARTIGQSVSLNDTWGVREYQYMLNDLGFYLGPINENRADTEEAVRAFQRSKGLEDDGIVGDDTWPVLIHDYLEQDSLSFDENRFIRNERDGCSDGLIQWLGCGERDPVDNRDLALRPNRRTEILFVKAEVIPPPCQVPRPVTLDIRPDGSNAPQWCLGPGSKDRPCCFLTRTQPQPDKWLVEPAEPGTITVRGSLRFEDGTPAANVPYVLIAPDGEFMDGERPTGADRGRPVIGRTAADGTFSYPDKPKGIGVYTLEIQQPLIAHLDGEPPETARGTVVCKRLDGTSDFDVTVYAPATTFELTVTGAARFGGPSATTFLATRSTTGEVIVEAVFPPGTRAAPRSIEWTNGDEVLGNPLQRSILRTNTGQTTVTATLTEHGVTRSVEIFIARVTLDVDADRDGVVEQDAQGKNDWRFGPGQRGAVILCNNDDDDFDATIDKDNMVIDGADDVSDLAPLVVRQGVGLPPGLSLELIAVDQERVRIFDQRAPGGTVIIGPAPLPGSFPITNNAAADVELGIEATQYPDSGFDGLVRLVLALKEGSTEIARDEVTLRVAPWVLSSHLQVSDEIYVLEMPGFNDSFVGEIQAAASAAGITLLRGLDVNYGGDQWVQDCMEIGYSLASTQSFSVVLNAVNRRGLENFANDELLGLDYGLHQPPFNPPSDPNTFDSHGNIEVSPPVTVGGKEFKLGRIFFGRGRPSEPFNSDVRAFLNAQLVQKPFETDTDWLGVGHVDEIISFVPSTVGRPFRMLLSNTREALRILTDLQDAGDGDATLFTGKSRVPFQERTIDDILADSSLLSGNAFCQGRLDAIETQFKAELGLADADIIHIPSLFVEEASFPGVFAALIPGMVNMLVITRPSFTDTQLAIPKPFGPVIGGVDQLERDVRSRLTPLGYTPGQIRFVDDFDTYHVRLGEVHCGTNSKRRPHSVRWWEQVDI